MESLVFVVKQVKFQIILKSICSRGHELNKDQLINELGDVCWYIAILATGLGADLETIMQKNIEKLMKRYPDGFKVQKFYKQKGR